MKILILLLGILVAQPCLAQGPGARDQDESIKVGPWTILTEIDNGYFWGCSMRRTVGEITMGFDRLEDGLFVGLYSPRWKLQEGRSYHVRVTVGAETKQAHAKAEDSKTVTVQLDDRAVRILGDQSAITVVTPSMEISIRMDEAKEALGKLEQCYVAQERARANPFGAPIAEPKAQDSKKK
jgi:hypothetical protein